MSENDLLDIGELQEQNECWYEDIDTTCPHCIDGKAKQKCEKCQGEGDCECPDCEGLGPSKEPVGCENPDCEYGRIGCDECNGLGEVESEEYCESCDGNGNFEILWNTAFRIPYLKTGLEFEDARTIAWDRGWLLFRYDNELWIAAGSCGYDFTWVKAACALEICGDLPDYYASNLSGGGYVFLHNHEAKLAVIAAAKTSLGYVIQRAQRDIEEFERLEKKFIFDEKIKLEASHATKVEKPEVRKDNKFQSAIHDLAREFIGIDQVDIEAAYQNKRGNLYDLMGALGRKWGKDLSAPDGAWGRQLDTGYEARNKVRGLIEWAITQHKELNDVQS